jgi:WhiB family transcriptional regulator, redox-sensing transcriptional regulator
MGVSQWPPRPHRAGNLSRPPKWTELAVCTEVGTELFYPEEGTSTAAPAAAICRSCEVRLTCLRDALTRPGELGVWGGFSERARRRVAREHADGKPLEDIIAEDDARIYGRLEAAAERGTYDERRPAIEREARRVKREAITVRTAQPRKAAA